MEKQELLADKSRWDRLLGSGVQVSQAGQGLYFAASVLSHFYLTLI